MFPLSPRAARYTDFSRLNGDQGEVAGHVVQNICESKFFIKVRFSERPDGAKSAPPPHVKSMEKKESHAPRATDFSETSDRYHQIDHRREPIP